MKRSVLVAKRELLENLKTKGFWIGILMMPIMLALVIFVPLLAETTKDVKKFIVIDQSGDLLPRIIREIEITDLVHVFQSNYLPKEFDNSPRILKSLRNQAEILGEPALRQLAEEIISDQAISLEAFPAELARQLEVQGKDMNRWWKSLDADARSALSPLVSSRHFLLLDSTNTDIEALNAMITGGQVFAYFVIGKDPLNSTEGYKYVSNNLTDRSLVDWLSRHLNHLVQQDRLLEKGIDPGIAAWINEPVRFEGVKISEEGGEEEVDTSDVVRQWAPVGFVYLLWIAIMVNTHVLLTNTVEEKSNRLIEVLLSSVSPLTLMAGKIMGIAATGICMLLVWGAIAFLILFVAGDGLDTFSQSLNLAAIIKDPVYLVSFLVYFILGFLFYAALLVGLGSMCSNLKEAQNLTVPVQMLQIVPLLLMIPVARAPEGTLAQVLSWFPPFTPFIMMNRAAAPPSSLEYAGTTLLMLISVGIALWLAAKIFRVGILLTGKPPSVKEILLLIKAPVSAPVVTLVRPKDESDISKT